MTDIAIARKSSLMKRPDPVREESKYCFRFSHPIKGTEEGPIGSYFSLYEQEICMHIRSLYLENKTNKKPN